MRPSGILLCLLLSSVAAQKDSTISSKIVTTTSATPETILDYEEDLDSEGKEIQWYREHQKEREEAKDKAHKDHPEYFVGNNRSPINIDVFETVPVYFEPMEFVNYNTTGTVGTNPHNDIVDSLIGFADWKQKPYIQSGGLNGRYNLEEVQLITNFVFFNSEDVHGHSINNAAQSMELHLIHVRNGLSMAEALQVEGAIATAVVFIDITVGNATGRVNTKIFPEHGGYESVMPSVLLPDDTIGFYRYNGSLMRPPCSSGVIYTLLSEPITITFEDYIQYWYGGNSKQMKHMEKIGQFMEELPPRGNRTVLLNYGIQKKPRTEVISTPVPYPWFSICLVAVLSASASAAGVVYFFVLRQNGKLDRLAFDNIAMDEPLA